MAPIDLNKLKYAVLAAGEVAKDATKDVAQKAKEASKDVALKAKDSAENVKGLIKDIKLPELKKNNNGESSDLASDTKEEKLDDRLHRAVDQYNATYTMLSDHGMRLFNQRARAIDLLDNVESLVNSIANSPKEFDTTLEEIEVNKKEFQDVCDYAEKELQEAKKSAATSGAGIAGGMAVASIAPSAAMWIATTFGTASTGTAISSLTGAAATKAALAWLGGGALSAGGGGIAAGQAFLAMAGPIGWTVAGATLLASIVLFANKKVKLNKEKSDEIKSVIDNTEQLREVDAKLLALLTKTYEVRNGLSEQYSKCMECFGKDYRELPENNQYLLGAMVNNAKALAKSLKEGVEVANEG